MTAETLELDDVQGLVIRGYKRLEGARYLLGEITSPPEARAWLGRVPVATAAPGDADEALNLALTAPGLTRLGLPADVLAQFSHEFAEGMTTPHRQRILGDVAESAPEHWRWGNPDGDPIHILLVVFGRTDASADAAAARHAAAMQESGIRLIATLTTAPLEDREHFGFRDGIAQPHIAGLQQGPERDAVAAGELVLGYENEYGRRTPRPLIDDPAAPLPPDRGGSGKRDLARNGTYLVFRQLEQDVRAFWDFCENATRLPDGNVDEPRRVKLAAQVIGRWPSGAPLALAPDGDRPDLGDRNDFAYFHDDRFGLACPVGAHVRRANPRDMLDPAPGTSRSVAVNKRHRLLRRGRKYGALLPRSDLLTAGTEARWNDTERGIHFISLGANLSRQFEFVQHSWLIDPRFNGAHEQVDPLIGPPPEGGRSFSVQQLPTRTRYTNVPTFVRVRGGAYFFLPGVRALRYLST